VVARVACANVPQLAALQRTWQLSSDSDSAIRRFESSSQSVSNASHMKVAQKPRGTARFRRYELVSVCGILQWRRHSCLLSPRAFFGVSFLMCALLSVRTGWPRCAGTDSPKDAGRRRRTLVAPPLKPHRRRFKMVIPKTVNAFLDCAANHAGDLSTFLVVAVM
jgi:hypothetical protein